MHKVGATGRSPLHQHQQGISTMTELRELYQQIILDHNKNPRNFGKLPAANRMQEGYNPLCGDHLHIYLHVADERIADISFDGSGCAISKASASLMTAALKGKRPDEAVELFEQFQQMVTAEPDAPVDHQALGKMAVFAGVREFPMRVKCATLAWHAAKAAIEQDPSPASTE